MGLGRFDEAKECYESLRSLNEREIADSLLKRTISEERSQGCPEMLTTLCQSAQTLSV